jgi:hypothetical protein
MKNSSPSTTCIQCLKAWSISSLTPNCNRPMISLKSTRKTSTTLDLAGREKGAWAQGPRARWGSSAIRRSSSPTFSCSWLSTWQVRRFSRACKNTVGRHSERLLWESLQGKAREGAQGESIKQIVCETDFWIHSGYLVFYVCSKDLEMEREFAGQVRRPRLWVV